MCLHAQISHPSHGTRAPVPHGPHRPRRPRSPPRRPGPHAARLAAEIPRVGDPGHGSGGQLPALLAQHFRPSPGRVRRPRGTLRFDRRPPGEGQGSACRCVVQGRAFSPCRRAAKRYCARHGPARIEPPRPPPRLPQQPRRGEVVPDPLPARRIVRQDDHAGRRVVEGRTLSVQCLVDSVDWHGDVVPPPHLQQFWPPHHAKL